MMYHTYMYKLFYFKTNHIVISDKYIVMTHANIKFSTWVGFIH